MTAWISFLLFLIILASGTFLDSKFIDKCIMPKQLCTYYFVGISALTLPVFTYFKGKMLNTPWDRILFLFILLLGIVFCLHNDIYSILNVLLLIVVYALCRLIPNTVTLDYVFLAGLSFCTVYAIIISSWQFVRGYSVNGGYDTISGLSLIIMLTFVVIMNSLKKRKKPIKQIILIIIVMIIFILLSMRTAIIALCCTLMLSLKQNLRMFIAILGVIVIFLLSINKLDSTYGRVIIYKTSLSLFNSPKFIIFGRGTTGFRSSYMQAQAKLLKKESIAKQKLADNIKHPLNEFLLFAINYGMPLLLMGSILFVVYLLKSRPDFLSNSLFVTIIIFAIFTYPFHYPITYLMLAYALAKPVNSLFYRNNGGNKIYELLISVMLLVSGVTLIVMSHLLWVWNIEWKKAYTNGRYGIIEKSLSEYDKLASSSLACNEFYYNWAYMLMTAHRTEDAIKIISNCKIIDYDTQMLKGDLYASIGNYRHALRYYKEASEMCPNRFLPLYAQYNLYDKQGMSVEKYHIGQIILSKEEKVPSQLINNIKEKIYESIH